METKPRFYLPELDGLRFIAFLLVFIHNANPILQGTFLEKFSEYSWFGVDLFFALSGYLITKLLVMEHEQTGNINIRNFYIRRALRIWPLYFFYIILGSIIIAPVEGRNINLPWHIASLSTFTFNFAYFALLPSPILIFVHLWSISYEAQFYAVIPWFIRKISGATQATKITWLASLFVIGIIVRGVFIQLKLHPASIYFLPISHFDSMLGGIAVGMGLLDKVLGKINTFFLYLIGIASISLYLILPNNDTNSWGLILTYSLLGIATTLLILLATKSNESFVKVFLSQRIFVELGKISYGLYVFHFGAFTLAVLLLSSILNVQKPSYPQFTAPVLIIAFTITLLFSLLSYRFIEKPALGIKSLFRSTRHT